MVTISIADDPPKGGRFLVFVAGVAVKPSKPDGKVLVAWGGDIDEFTPIDQVKSRAEYVAERAERKA